MQNNLYCELCNNYVGSDWTDTGICQFCGEYVGVIEVADPVNNPIYGDADIYYESVETFRWSKNAK